MPPSPTCCLEREEGGGADPGDSGRPGVGEEGGEGSGGGVGGEEGDHQLGEAIREGAEGAG